MKGYSILFLILTYTLLTSFNYQKESKVPDVKILRYLTAKTSFQSVEYNNGIVSKWIRFKTPLVVRLNDYQNYELQAEIKRFDVEKFKSEIDNLSDLKEGIYPKIYYKIVLNGDTIQTKDFLQKDMPSSIKKIDNLMLKFTTFGISY